MKNQIAVVVLFVLFGINAFASEDMNSSEQTSLMTMLVSLAPSAAGSASAGAVNKEVLIHARKDAHIYLQTNRMSPFLLSVIDQLRTNKDLADKSSEEIIDALAGLE